jgi:hypothetical protein
MRRSNPSAPIRSLSPVDNRLHPPTNDKPFTVPGQLEPPSVDEQSRAPADGQLEDATVSEKAVDTDGHCGPHDCAGLYRCGTIPSHSFERQSTDTSWDWMGWWMAEDFGHWTTETFSSERLANTLTLPLGGDAVRLDRPARGLRWRSGISCAHPPIGRTPPAPGGKSRALIINVSHTGVQNYSGSHPPQERLSARQGHVSGACGSTPKVGTLLSE